MASLTDINSLLPEEDSIESQIASKNQAVSSFNTGMDSHNIANGNFSLTSPDTWSQGVTNAGYAVVGAAVSGVNGIVNSGIRAANFLGGDLELNNTAEQLASIDDDLGKYYRENKGALDTAGFVAASLVPGLAGVKLLNASAKFLGIAEATGIIGDTTASSFGLLSPVINRYLAASATEMTLSTASASIVNANLIKAVGAGFAQSALESVAFQTAVNATNFASPILEDQDAWDLVKGTLESTFTGLGAAGTVLGGAINTSKIFGIAKRSKQALDLADKPFTYIHEYKSLPSSSKIISYMNDIDGVNAATLDSSTPELLARQQRLQGGTVDKLKDLVKIESHNLVGGQDTELGKDFANLVLGMDSKNSFSALTGVQKVARVAEDLSSSKGVVQYIKLLGEDTGTLFSSAPKITSLADSVAGKAKYSITGKKTLDYAEAIDEAVAKAKFTQKSEWSAIDPAVDHLTAQKRYIWASKQELKAGTVIGEYDIPLLERAFDKFVTKAPETEALESIPFSVKVKDATGITTDITNADDLFNYLRVSKQKAADYLVKSLGAGADTTLDEIAYKLNIKRSYLEGEQAPDIRHDLLAYQHHQDMYDTRMLQLGETKAVGSDIRYKPQFAAIETDTSRVTAVNGNLVSGMAYVKAEQKLYQNTINNTVAAAVGTDRYQELYHPDESLLLKANSQEPFANAYKSSNSDLGTLGSWSQYTGKVTNSITKDFVDKVTTKLAPILYKLSSNQEAAIEWEKLGQSAASTTERYVLSSDGSTLIAKKLYDYQQAIAAGKTGLTAPILQEGAKALLPIANQEVKDAIAAHIELNGSRLETFKNINAAKGLVDERDASIFYPPKPNPRDYKHFAFVVDDTITGAGHVKMLHATSAEDLKRLSDKATASGFDVVTSSKSDRWHKAMNDYEFDKTLHENYIDSSMVSKGINSQFYVRTDPATISKSILDFHTHNESILAREVVASKFEKEFAELKRLAEQSGEYDISKYGSSSTKALEQHSDNSYIKYIKQSLNLDSAAPDNMWLTASQLLDKKVSQGYRAIEELFSSSKSTGDLEKVNDALKKYGVQSSYYDTALEALANRQPDKGVLNSFIRGAHSIISALTIRTDPFNAVNNFVGSHVLLGAETNNVLKGIRESNTEAAGKLTSLLGTAIPGTNDLLQSPAKLIANAYKAFFSEGADTLLAEFKAKGLVTSISEQHRALLNDLTIAGTEDASTLSSKLQSAFTKSKLLAEKGELYSGNKLAEEMNRFVAAHSMKQLTDLAVEVGTMGKQEAWSYINTFVNRTQGVTLASQRPLMFKGALGQAIGLFQSYQFNMMQQLFRHVENGNTSSAAYALGLQSTLFGANGLPAFNFMNTHIIGTMSDNPSHKDVYSTSYNLFGKQVGDLLLYGFPSALTGTSLYTRGDLNPRQLTVVPVNPSDIPVVNVALKAFGNVKGLFSTISNGASVWNSFLGSVEHNGLSRPLAGFAQIARSFNNDGIAYATSNKGSIVGSNELFSYASGIRMLGSRPLDEARLSDEVQRTSVYQAVDSERRKSLGTAIKTSVVSNQVPTASQIQQFSYEYMKTGGSQKEFNKFMIRQVREANTTQADGIVQHLKSNYSQRMQAVMQGSATVLPLNNRGFTSSIDSTSNTGEEQ